MYTSPTTPSTTYDYDVRTGQRTLLKQEPVLGSFDSRNYVAEFRFVPARDGVRVPVTLLYRKGTRLDGTAPTVSASLSLTMTTTTLLRSANRRPSSTSRKEGWFGWQCGVR